jgi:hypothetical protein
MKTTQIEKDIAFCIDELDLSNEQIGELLRACENLGNISCEYFCEHCQHYEEVEYCEGYEYKVGKMLETTDEKWLT